MIVPWYDVIPQVGAVLFAVGWWTGPHQAAGPARPPADGRRPGSGGGPRYDRGDGDGAVVLNRPRVNALFRGTVPSPNAREQEFFQIPRLLTLHRAACLFERVEWQRRYLHRLDQAEIIGAVEESARMGSRAAFDFLFIPGSTSRILFAQREHYDVAGLLNIPAHGPVTDPAEVREALGPWLIPEPEPHPRLLPPDEVWPPESAFPRSPEDELTFFTIGYGGRRPEEFVAF